MPIHPLIASRWSPRSFNTEAALSREDLIAILEAGRWAPSAFNFQPWRFSVGLRGDQVFTKISESLQDFNKLWAPNSSALILISVETVKEDGSAVPTALYDAGLAASLMAIEAAHRNLHTHHLVGFDHEAAKISLGLAPTVKPVAIIAIGTAAGSDQLTGPLKEREEAPRVRKPLSEISNFH